MDITNIEHQSITDENRGAFATHMEKFATMEDAALDGMSLKQMTGKPFKFPESMDKLPDDASRADFTDGANKLLGRTIPKDLESFADVNFKVGLNDDAKVDDALIGVIKQWAVDKKVPTESLGKMIELFNGPMSKHIRANGELMATAAAEKAKADHSIAVKTCNDSLAAHADFGSAEVLDGKTVKLHQALMNNSNLSTDEANGIAEFLRDREGATNPTLRRLMINQFAPLAMEGDSEDGIGGDAPAGAAPTPKQQMPKTAEILGW